MSLEVRYIRIDRIMRISMHPQNSQQFRALLQSI
uniref:Uncharacterized protein n=1 Tax=Siphoviridae sp. ct8NQ14 TaxID=2825363 RepID=A0A8S5PNV6_9CAUD|nr:MAG TPA: hypothetical protein [Siphoviridae sp. ct8NQ14]